MRLTLSGGVHFVRRLCRLCSGFFFRKFWRMYARPVRDLVTV